MSACWKDNQHGGDNIIDALRDWEVPTYGDDLHALRCEVLGGRLAGIARDAANLELLGQLRVSLDGTNDGATLVAGRAENRNEL